MKKAEDYVKERPFLGAFLSSAQGYEIFISTIKQAQEDAIKETINTCGSVGLLTDHILYEIAYKLIKEL